MCSKLPDTNFEFDLRRMKDHSNSRSSFVAPLYDFLVFHELFFLLQVA